MVEKETRIKDNYSNKSAAAYSFGQVSLVTAYQSFTFLIFTFYYTIVGLNANLISIGFLIWSIWNAFNDPIMGHISDRTHTRWGRRRPYIMIGLVPLGVVTFLLFMPPVSYGILTESANFTYFLIIIVLFELCYTMYDINLSSMFPEVFITKEDRIRANNIRQAFAIIGLIFAFVLPGLIIPDYSNPKYLPQYQMLGIILMIIIIVVGSIFLKFSPREKKEFQYDYKTVPSFLKSMQLSVKNKSFRWLIPAFIGDFYVATLLPTLVPLHGKFVLGIGEGESIFLSLLLGIDFISAAIFMTILWKPVVKKIGLRKSWMWSSVTWILTLFPLMFIQDKWGGMIIFFLAGIGLSGSLYIKDLVIADIIDEDEVNTGSRKEASYYGIYIFFLRVSTIFVFFSISLVFTNVGWAVFTPENVTEEVIFGLKTLMFIFPAIALCIVILSLYKYPLDGDRLRKVKEDIEKIHQDKKSKI